MEQSLYSNEEPYDGKIGMMAVSVFRAVNVIQVYEGISKPVPATTGYMRHISDRPGTAHSMLLVREGQSISSTASFLGIGVQKRKRRNVLQSRILFFCLAYYSSFLVW
jgi:hypothetical protein